MCLKEVKKDTLNKKGLDKVIAQVICEAEGTSFLSDHVNFVAADHYNFCRGFLPTTIPCCLVDGNSLYVIFFDGLKRTFSLGDQPIENGTAEKNPDPSPDFIVWVKKGPPLLFGFIPNFSIGDCF